MSDFPDPVFCGHKEHIRTHVQAVLVDFKAIDVIWPRLFLRAQVWCELCGRDYKFLGYQEEKMRLDRPNISRPMKGTVLDAPLTLGDERAAS